MSKTKRKKGKLEQKKELNQKEKKLREFAKIAWAKTLAAFYFPPLNEPNYVFDYSNLEGFYIDFDDRYKITMNLANTPLFLDDQYYINYFHAITLHEVSHYQIIPYDGLVNAKLLRAAMKYVPQYFAPIVVNIVADLIIDLKLYYTYPELISWEIKQTYEHVLKKSNEGISDFSKFLFNAYEKLLNINISEENSFSHMDALTIRVVNVIKKDFENESLWEQKTSRVASQLSSLIKDTFTLIGRGVAPGKNKTKRKSPGKEGGQIEFTEDILEIMDNPLENKNIDKLKEDNQDDKKQKAEEFAKDTPYSEFGAPAGQAGILIDGSVLATWYRGIAKDLIEIKIYEEKPGGLLPVYPHVWRIGEPIEELDIVQTLLNSPVIIPNITTRKWVKEEGSGHLIEKELPDLLIVIDSSGSMNWNYTTKSPKNPYHIALVASFAALHYVAKKGVKFSVINFSNRADISDWSYDYSKAEKVLLRYQGGGTHLPIEAILDQCNKAEKKALIFIITDFGIYNWTKAKKTMIKLAEKGHKIVGFFIGSAKIPEEKFQDLRDKMTFYPIKNVKDLIDLVIEEVKKYYL